MARRRVPDTAGVRSDARAELLARERERSQRRALFPDGSIVLDTRAAQRARALQVGRPVVFAGWEVRRYLPPSLTAAAWVRLEADGSFTEMRVVRDSNNTISWKPAQRPASPSDWRS